MTTILSYGGGVNSTALLLEWLRRGLETQTTLDSYTDSEEAASIPCMCYDG